jgi:hypothetical protein
MGVKCDCEKGLVLCAEAERLWRAKRAAADIAGELMAASIAHEDDPIIYDRWRIAEELKHKARREYDCHVDLADEPVPEPQSLKVVE